MSYILFFLYCAFFCWLITKLPFFKKSGIGSRILIVLFIIRVVSALIGCYLNLYYFPVSDSIGFQRDGIRGFHLLLNEPSAFLSNLFTGKNYSGFLSNQDTFWNDLRSQLLGKMLSIFNIFSGENYVINALFYNFLVFFGVVALYRALIKIFPSSFYILIICIFLFPSALFFSSLVHRDGLILLGICIIIFHLHGMMEQRKFSVKKLLIIFFFLLLILLLRNFVFFILVPALVAWIIAIIKPRFAFISFLSVYAITIAVFFCSPLISSKTNLPNLVTEKQADFIQLSAVAASSIKVDTLQPTIKSFILNAPQAFNHAFMRPYLTEMAKPEYFPFALEAFFVEILLILFVFFNKKIKMKPIAFFFIFLSVSMFMIIGYTIPILGALVRYRSIYYIFLIVVLANYIDWERVKNSYNNIPYLINFKKKSEKTRS